ncbi:Aste57867_10184 [Aphanomyces stellatus]|uniref:Aste57867_10184 protein n=1 Tax=Aphanomyces stellatus TaxID=120398 RepID=A0A485KQG8_9STRA|nr:hypothetical protein As57867_010145 [Aphanomyces stellatus]VFT87060.1 Aste57867_10184 [Aphanomyces stellatus]
MKHPLAAVSTAKTPGSEGVSISLTFQILKRSSQPSDCFILLRPILPPPFMTTHMAHVEPTGSGNIMRKSAASVASFRIMPSSSWRASLAIGTTSVALIVGHFAALLVVLDVVGNNWELNHYVDDAKHFFTPLFNVNDTDTLARTVTFPKSMSPLSIGNVGRHMIATTINQAHDEENRYYHLTAGEHTIVSPTNDICGTIAKSYPMGDAAINATVRLGTVLDTISFFRGTALTNVFGSTLTDPGGVTGDNSTQLIALGYTAGRVTLDLRLMTAIQVPPPGQLVSFNVTMYSYTSKGFCSGCHHYTELGKDVCTIVYSFNDTTKQLVIKSSGAIYGNVHDLGIVFQQHWITVLSMVIRGLCVVVAIASYAASKKTVRWTDHLALDAWYKRLLHLLSPPHYRYTNRAFNFLYLCFNSDIFVLLYTTAIALDEGISMMYARAMNRWALAASFNLWNQLRFWALGFRWLWLNLALLKGLKWLLNFLSTTRYSGSNPLVGLLNFRSVTFVYLTVVVLFNRTNYIEYGNTNHIEVSSAVQDLDALNVSYEDSYYIRNLPSLFCLMLGNLLAVVGLDHVVNRRWWRTLAKNSFGRQHMFNSTSILSDMDLPLDKGSSTTMTVKARTLCTFQWFFTSHLTCFGLPEEPSVIRKFMKLTTSRASLSNLSKPPTDRINQSKKDDPKGPDDAIVLLQAMAGAGTETYLESSTTDEQHILVQDKDGHLHLYDMEKHEVQALGIEIKILRDTSYNIG